MLGGANDMKVLRWVLGALVLVYGVLSALVAGMAAVHKIGKLATVPAELQKMVPLWDAMPWWQIALCGVVALLLLVAAWRLFTGGKAFGPFLLAAIGEAGLWWVMHKMPAYPAAMPCPDPNFALYGLGGLAVVALAVWVTERGK
jgi:hypothetical protein